MGLCDGRVVIITGAGRGVGRAHAVALAQAGARVVVNDLGVESDGTVPSRQPAEEVVAEIRAAGGEARASPESVADWDGARRLVATAIEEFGRLDAVINNAGILRSGFLLRVGPEDWRAVLEVHLLGTFFVTRWAAAYWRDQTKAGRTPDARVVNTTSVAGLYGFVGEAAYSAAKAGVVGFTLTAAAELARYGVTVNAIGPLAHTRMTAWSAELAQRLGGPEHVAPLAVWLVSGDSAGVTGRVFEVGGGRVSVVEGMRPGASVQSADIWDPGMLGAAVRGLLAEAPQPVPAWDPLTTLMGVFPFSPSPPRE